ncbi:MAG TPA: hypothetical protein VK464_00720 [Symbiobacteriaceae bacterium]|nr:hypothetical protein [Symbiobacteriaceae bacterium]
MTRLLYAGYGTLPPVGGPFACPGCLTGFPPFNPYFGTFGRIPPFGGFPGFPGFPGFGPMPGFNPFIGTYPGICTGCI